MSNWTAAEVAALDGKNGGGNQACAHRWLANAPESVRPSPDSHIDVKKAFVTRAYDKKEFESSGPIPVQSSSSTTSQPSAHQTRAPKVEKAPPVRSAAPVQARAAPVQAPTVDLLDVDTFTAPAAAATPAPVASSCNLLDDFNPQPAAQSTMANTSSVNGVGGAPTASAFSFINAPAPDVTTTAPMPSQASTPSSGSAFSFVAMSQSSEPTGQVSFDPLATPSAAPVTPQPQAQPQVQPQAQPQVPAMSSFNTGMYGWQGAPNQQQYHPQQQQQQVWSAGNAGYGQMMNPYMAAASAAPGQPWQASMPGAFAHNGISPPHPMMAGNHGLANGQPMNSGAALREALFMDQGNSSGAAAANVSGASQNSSFDPFDPFAPDPISVHG